MNRRNTIQREMILQAVQELKNHATADEVYSYILNNYPYISKGTVYRNLTLLAQNGKIRRVQIPNGPDRFDHNYGKHYHVECIYCKKVYDVDMEYIPDLKNYIHKNQGFQFIDHDILFHGICPNCQD